MKEKNHDMGLFKHFYDLPIFFTFESKGSMLFHVVSCYFI